MPSGGLFQIVRSGTQKSSQASARVSRIRVSTRQVVLLLAHEGGRLVKSLRVAVEDRVSKAIGWARNHHEAAYNALIEGVELARRDGIDRIRVSLDSVLVVNAANGDWNLAPAQLKVMCTSACSLVKEFADIKLCWVPREMNSQADALASRALGRGHARGVPEAAADGERKA
jgi:ribonuclease HI